MGTQRSKGRVVPGALVLLCLLAWGGVSGLRAEGWLAGIATRDITPKEPVPMWGYGGRHDHLSVGVRDPLRAEALVLAAGTERLAIVTLDLGRAPGEDSIQRIRARLAQTSDIQHSFIGSSHTHHGPVLELVDEPGRGRGRFDAAVRYVARLEDEIVGVVEEANRGLKPALLQAGSGRLEGMNRNRHAKVDPKPVDPSLVVLRVLRPDNAPGVVLFNFAAHPTSIPAEDLRFSADWVGAAKGAIEAGFGGTAMFIQGAAGDLSARRAEGEDYVGYGRRVGQEVLKLAGGLGSSPGLVPSLQFKEGQLRYVSRVDFLSAPVRAIYGWAFFPELVANYVEEYRAGIRPRLAVARLGGLPFVGVSGEFFCQHAVRMRSARPGPLVFMGYCNGYHQYFPTREAAAQGGYGADMTVSPAAVGAGEDVMATAAEWLKELEGR